MDRAISMPLKKDTLSSRLDLSDYHLKAYREK